MERIERTWYASEGSRWAEFLTILHPPYTGMVLCYVVLGALLVPEIHAGRLLWMVIAYFLGLGIGAHALDQLSGRPYGRSFTIPELWGLAIGTLAVAIAIGAYYAVTLTPWLWLLLPLDINYAWVYGSSLGTALAFGLAGLALVRSERRKRQRVRRSRN